jgi:hypothetical protein
VRARACVRACACVCVVFTNSVAKFRGLPKSFEMTACVLRATSLTGSASVEERHTWHCDLKCGCVTPTKSYRSTVNSLYETIDRTFLVGGVFNG